MRPETHEKLKKIKRISTILRALCKGLLALITIGFLLATVALVASRGGVGYFDLWFWIGDLSLGHRLMVLAMSTLTSLVMFKCVYHLHQLFGNYSREEIFTGDSIGQLRQLGITCILWGVVKILWVGLWRTLSAHPPHSVQVSADAIPIGIVILVVAWFMEMAIEMREENELTV